MSNDLGTLNYLEMFPETYDLPGVRVEQKRFAEGDARSSNANLLHRQAF
jgi:hypothetical protein